jgi:hypothetical protein
MAKRWQSTRKGLGKMCKPGQCPMRGPGDFSHTELLQVRAKYAKNALQPLMFAASI